MSKKKLIKTTTLFLIVIQLFLYPNLFSSEKDSSNNTELSFIDKLAYSVDNMFLKLNSINSESMKAFLHQVKHDKFSLTIPAWMFFLAGLLGLVFIIITTYLLITRHLTRQLQQKNAKLEMDFNTIRKLERSLHESKSNLFQMIDTNPNMLFVMNLNRQFLFANQATADAFGKPVKELIGTTYEGKLFEDSENVFDQSDFINPTSEELIRHTLTDVNGQKRIIDVKKTPFRMFDDSVYKDLYVASEVIKLDNTLIKLRDERDFLENIVFSIHDGIIITDDQLIVTKLNKEASDIIQRVSQHVIGKHLGDILIHANPISDPDKHNFYRSLLELSFIEKQHFELVIRTPKKEDKMLAISIAPLVEKEDRAKGYVLVLRDITSYKTYQTQVNMGDKFESIGRFAGGVAHNFRSLLGDIKDKASQVKSKLKPNSSNFTLMSEIQSIIEKAFRFSAVLVSFDQNEPAIKESVEIKDIFSTAESEIPLKANITCQYKVTGKLHTVDVDERQIMEVLENIVLNSCQAMPDGGTIEITASNTFIRDRQKLSLSPGEYVLIKVQDPGVGIHKKYLHKVYDPFFSTKQMEDGLGLTIAFAIIKRHNGTMIISSEVGKGTEIDIYLPASKKVYRKKRIKKDSATRIKGRILVMDDDDTTRTEAGKIMHDLGYKVDLVPNGQLAVQTYTKSLQSDKPIDLLFLDVDVSQGMGAKDAIKRLVAIDPEVRTIVVSGYSTDPVLEKHVLYGFQGILTKPYKTKDVTLLLSRFFGE